MSSPDDPQRQVAQVLILPAAGDTGLLDYDVAGHPLAIGVRVLVPLGSRPAVGLVVGLIAHSEQPRLRRILAVLEPRPVLDAPLLELCRWMADYYLGSFAEAVTAALPGAVRMKTERVVRRIEGEPENSRPPALIQQKILNELACESELPVSVLERRCGTDTRKAIEALRRRGLVGIEHRLRPASGRTRHRRFYRVRETLGPDDAAKWARKRPAMFRLYAYLAEHPLRRATMQELESSFPQASATVRRLRAERIVEVIEEELLREVLPEGRPRDRPVTLSTAQATAVDEITRAIGRRFAPFLLWGVTGSGKTEVFLRAIAQCLEQQRTSLVLVPEISLTHQIVDRIRARFGDGGIAVLHSGLSDGERWDEWRRIAAGDASIVVGARSAVFAPLPRLGLVIVDEEHDAAYKQEDGLRYNGRDLAVMRAKLAGCPAILGSATPALETYLNARTGRYHLLELRERVAERPLPAVELVDLRPAGGVARSTLLSPRLLAALRANLAAGNQSLIFLNRRGFANFLQCHQCGTPLECPNCSVSLTLHQRWQALRCHHCDHTIAVPSTCPSCGGIALGGAGAGTEQVEIALKQLVPGARVSRMDRDTTSRKGAQREILAAWERGESDILVGTQMIAKGHDVHAVTLVGVLLADSGLNFPDFRAAERTFQTLAQVAGRAGRGDQPGRVIIQTYQPQHPSLRFAMNHDFRGYADHELAERREHDYPPYTRMVQIRCEGEGAETTMQIARALQEALAGIPSGVTVLGPGPAAIDRLRRRYRWQLLLRGRSGADLRRAARRARDSVRAAARSGDVRVIVDVDPYDML